LEQTNHEYKNGKRTRTIKKIKYSEDPEIVETTIYDENENSVEVKTSYAEGLNEQMRFVYVYDNHLNWIKKTMTAISSTGNRTETTERKITYYE
jgi:hypothetical protein